MGIQNWWKRRSGGAKAVTVLATLLTLQIGLCFSTGLTVLPAYQAIFGPSSDSELGLGLIIWQGILCGVTILLLAVTVIGAAWVGGFSKKDRSGKDSND